MPSTREYFIARRTQKDLPMATLHDVYGVTTPPQFDELQPGSYTLRAPFRDSDGAEGGALQVGLEPYEYNPEDKREVIATISERLGHRAIELALPDEKPFIIESSLDDDESRVDVLGRAVTKLIVSDTMGPWMDVTADGEEPIEALGPEGLNRFVQNLVTFSLIKQEAAAKAQAASQSDA